MRTLFILAALALGLGVAAFSTPAAPAGEKGQAKIRPVTKTIEGKLQALDLQKGMLKVKKGQEETVTVKLAAETKVVIDGKPGTLNQLQKGDVLVVTYEIRQDTRVAQMIMLNRPR